MWYRLHCLPSVSLAFSLLWVSTVPCFGVTATRGPIEKDGKTIDEKAIFLENQYVKVGITTNKFAGQVMHFIYRPTGEELAPLKIPQGLCMDRMGEGRQYFVKYGREHQGRILSQSEEKAEALIRYLWDYDHDGVKTTFEVRKTYLLARGSAAVQVQWELKNTGKVGAFFTPWIKHVARCDKEVLVGPRRLLLEKGPTDPGGDFIKPATDWTVMRNGTENSEKRAMMCTATEYRQIFQQFLCSASYRITLETILNRTRLEPGKTWQITYVLSAMANLGNILYSCPELSAGLGETTLAPGKETAVRAFLTPAVALGTKRLEGEITDLDGKLVSKLPNREVTLAPGRVSRADYTFTPPADGVYNVVLSVFDNQTPLALGQTVKSQARNIVLPMVVGPAPEVVVKPWQGGEFAYPRRKPRSLKPWRTLLESDRLKVGQFRMPERIFPEDKIGFAAQTESGHARLAKGEYEDIQFVLDFAKEEDVMGLEASVSAIEHKDGSALENVQLREAVYLTTTTPSGYKAFPIGEWPDPLFTSGWHKRIPNAPVTKRNVEVCRKSRRRTFIVVAQAPRQGPAGTYSGTVTLRLAGAAEAKFPVTFRVNDFALPKRAHFRCSTGMVGFGARRWAKNAKIMGLPEDEIAAVEKERGSMDRYRELAIEYGWTPTMWAGRKFWEQYYDHGRGISVFSGASQKDVPWLKEKGLLKYAFVYAPFDEHQDSQVPEVAAWAREWKKKCEVPILDCYYGGNVKPLFGLVDLWLGQSPQQEWAKERKKHGDQFIGCNQSLQWYLEYAPVVGRADFWNDFQIGYDGRYVYSTCRWTDDIYEKNWSCAGNYLGSVTYPAPDGVCTSIRFETMRDGVEDYDYLALLRAAALEAKKTAPGSPKLKEAEAILNGPKLAERVKTVEDLHRMRDRIADLIEEIGNGR